MPLLQEALEIARSLNKRRFVAETLRYIADALSFMADFAAARTCYSEALALAEMLGAESLAASIVASLASNEYDAGNLETALMLITDALAKYRALGSSALRGLTTALGDSAKYLIALGRYGQAPSTCRGDCRSRTWASAPRVRDNLPPTTRCYSAASARLHRSTGFYGLCGHRAPLRIRRGSVSCTGDTGCSGCRLSAIRACRASQLIGADDARAP